MAGPDWYEKFEEVPMAGQGWYEKFEEVPNGRTRLVRIFFGSTQYTKTIGYFPKIPHQTNTDLGFRVYTSRVSMKFHKMFNTYYYASFIMGL